MNIHIYCAKCRSHVSHANVQQLMPQQAFVISFRCHGVAESMVLSQMDVQQPGSIIIGVEYRTVNK